MIVNMIKIIQLAYYENADNYLHPSHPDIPHIWYRIHDLRKQLKNVDQEECMFKLLLSVLSVFLVTMLAVAFFRF